MPVPVVAVVAGVVEVALPEHPVLPVLPAPRLARPRVARKAALLAVVVAWADVEAEHLVALQVEPRVEHPAVRRRLRQRPQRHRRRRAHPQPPRIACT
jgi:hypothetical protein